MDVKKALYISQEVSPYVAASPMAMFGRRVAESIVSTGVEVRSFMPRYGAINERRNQLHEVIRLSGLNIPIDDTDHPLIIKVATLQPTRMQVYFIDNDDYFNRHSSGGLETDTKQGENDERAIFFVRGVLETAKKLRWLPDVIHCTGWITALAPAYIKRIYGDDPAFSSSKVVYSLFDKPFEGALNAKMIKKLVSEGFSEEDLSIFENNVVDFNTLNKIAMSYADAIAISSSNVSEELIAFAHASGKPVLDYPDNDPEHFAKAYGEFYQSL